MEIKQTISLSRKRWSFGMLKAIRHAKIMTKNPEDTRSAYHIRGALRMPAFYTHAISFIESDIGRKIYNEEHNLADLLDDPERLSKMPVGSVGYTYWTYMIEEGLSAKDLRKAYYSYTKTVPSYDDRIEWYLERQCDTHDLIHVLTSYRTDNLGEQCLLGFSDSQCPSLGALFIAYAGGFAISTKLPSAVSVFTPIREGRSNGRKAKIIAHQRIKELLPVPLERAREMLNISKPIVYHENFAKIQTHDIDPYDILENHNKYQTLRA